MRPCASSSLLSRSHDRAAPARSTESLPLARRSHVILPKALVKYLPKERLPEEEEWRSLGIRQSPGWWAYEVRRRRLSHAPTGTSTRGTCCG